MGARGGTYGPGADAIKGKIAGIKRLLAAIGEDARMTLLGDLHTFVQEHERCGELDSAGDPEYVWMTCTRGAAISRRIDGD